MPKQPKRWFLLVSVLSAWLLSGCITNLAPVRALPREALASVTEVALAVGADGVKHYAWTECSGENATYTCVLVYSRVVLGVVVYSHGFVTPIGTFAQNPDVAVSSTGDAYVVRSECTDGFNCVDYWSMFPADPENVEIDSQLLYTPTLNSAGPPIVEARGVNVYAAHFVEIGSDTRMLYRQLSGGSRGGLVDTSLQPPSSASLAIDSAGDLHAVWVRNPVSDTIIAYANNIGAPSDFNAPTTFDGGSDYLVSRPDLALDSDDRAYLAYAIYNGSDDTIKVRCVDLAANCWRGVTTLIVPQVDGPWDLYRNANLEVINKQPNVVFSARNDSVLSNDVWLYRPPSSGGNTPAAQVSNTAGESEAEPLIVKENSDAGDVAVIGWRIFRTLLAETTSPAITSGVCFGDVYMMYSSLLTLRQIFEDRDTCDNSGFDMAANGPWVAGVWVDEESDQIATHAAWTAFNAYGVHLPALSR